LQAKISNSLLPKLLPEAKPYEVLDIELKGFLLRVQPTGTLAYYCSYRTANGKRNRVSLGRHPTVTPAQARDHAKQILADVVRGCDPAKQKRKAKSETLSVFLETEYAPWVLAHRKDGQATIDRIHACFDKFKNNKLSELTSSTLERWRTKRLTNGIAIATVNRDLASLRSALSKAVEWGSVDTHPMLAMKPLELDQNKVVRFLSENEENQLRSALDERNQEMCQERDRANAWRAARNIAQLPDLKLKKFADHLYPMVIISINTGIRQGELFNLTWKNIDLDRANLTIVGTSAKSGKTRHIPLNTESLDALKCWKAQSAEEPLVFPSPTGRAFDNVKKAWSNLLTKAKIEKFRWHDMRHHFASRLVSMGVSLNTVRELLGHGDIKMTLRYAHLAPDVKAAAVAKLART
jgi:integrase